MKKNVKQLNLQALLESGVLLSLAVWLLVYLVSGRYLVYVTPRMLPYLIGTVVTLLIFAGIALTRLFRPNRLARVTHVFALALPLLLLLLPHGVISVSSEQFSSAPAAAKAAQTPPSSATPSAAGQDAQETAPPAETAQDAMDGLDSANKTIAVTTENYYDWMERLYNDAAAYEGYTVSITGYVINGSDVFAADEFALARLVMTCCVADLTPVGVICKYDYAGKLKADEWVSVEGTLQAGSYTINGETYTEPQLLVNDISPADEIAGYVYPY